MNHEFNEYPKKYTVLLSLCYLSHPIWSNSIITDSQKSDLEEQSKEPIPFVCNKFSYKIQKTAENHTIDTHFSLILTHYCITITQTHTHTHTHTKHIVAQHSQTIAQHLYTIAQHSQTIAQYLHTVVQHPQTIGQYLHTVVQCSQTTAQHLHTVAQHSQIIAQHLHTVAQHSQTIAQHLHTVANSTYNETTEVFQEFHQSGGLRQFLYKKRDNLNQQHTIYNI